MTPSAYEATEPWVAEPWAVDLPGSAAQPEAADEWGRPWATPGKRGDPGLEDPDGFEGSDTQAEWARDEAFERAAGLSGRGVVALGALTAIVCAALDLALTGGQVTFFFDLCFVVICLVTTMAVRRTDLFTAGVLPPLLFAAVIALLALVTPHAFESAPGVNKVFLTGLANHAGGLVFGYGVALAAVAARIATSSDRQR